MWKRFRKMLRCPLCGNCLELTVFSVLTCPLDERYLSPAKEADSLAAALDTLMLQPELRKRLSCGALAMAQEWFSWDNAVERTMNVFGFAS
jgi:glycosyltransferase involved in cell wall biosynthesis